MDASWDRFGWRRWVKAIRSLLFPCEPLVKLGDPMGYKGKAKDIPMERGEKTGPRDRDDGNVGTGPLRKEGTTGKKF
jgi:hypothetical protein